MNARGNTVGAVVYAARVAAFALRLIPNRDVVWVDVNDGSEERERWSRREQFRTLRPRYYGWSRRLNCGCTRRLGRIYLFAMECETHGIPGLLGESV